MRYLTSEAGAIGCANWLRTHNYHHVMNPVEVKISNKVFHYTISTEEEKFYVLYKHDFFYTFPDKYKEFFAKYPNLNSAGESINFDRLIWALNNNYTLIFVYESGIFYEIKPQEILNVHLLAKEFYENGFIREQDRVNREIQEGFETHIKERTVSFPVKAMSRRLE